MTPEQEAKFQARFDAESEEEVDPRFKERLAQEKAETQERLVNPVGATLAGSGAALGIGRLINAFESGAGVDVTKLAKEFNVPPEVIAKGDNAVINYIKAMHTGDVNYVGGESYKEAHALTEKAKEMSRNAPPGFKYDPVARQYIPESEYDIRAAARAKADQRSKPLTTRIVEKSPTAGRAVLGTQSLLKKGLPPFAGRTIAGGFGGYNAAETYNRAIQGDIPGAAISGTGALGALSSLSGNPKARGLGILGMGVSALANKFYDSPTEEADVVPGAVKSVMQGFAKGRKVVQGGLEMIGREPPAIKSVMQQATPLWERFGYDPKKIAQQYPDTAPPILKPKETGGTFESKQLSPEALAVQKARQAAQKEIASGSAAYSPYFDITKRSYVDPTNYSMPDQTIRLTLPKKAETLAKHQAIAQNPEATARLEGAFNAAVNSPKAHGFYQMKQLEDAFINELGPEAGRQAFRERFALPMAATTGGQTPNANLMMAAMHNYYANKGMQIPSRGVDLPYPVGGDKLQSNIDKSQQLFQTGALSAVDSPKRYNFASNFMGYADRPTIDEQMMRLFDPKGKASPAWYGVNEEAVNILAKKHGVDPVNFQEVAWAGGKGYGGQPMMEEINQMIYRTSRITGQSPEEVLRGFIRGNKPMYGVTGLGAIGAGTEGVNNPE